MIDDFGFTYCFIRLNYILSFSFQADQRVFRDLMAEKLPRLHRHFETHNIDTSLITFNWLVCIYCDNVPPETMLHIWDVYLSEGSKVLAIYQLTRSCPKTIVLVVTEK